MANACTANQRALVQRATVASNAASTQMPATMPLAMADGVGLPCPGPAVSIMSSIDVIVGGDCRLLLHGNDAQHTEKASNDGARTRRWRSDEQRCVPARHVAAVGGEAHVHCREHGRGALCRHRDHVCASCRRRARGVRASLTAPVCAQFVLESSEESAEALQQASRGSGLSGAERLERVIELVNSDNVRVRARGRTRPVRN